MSLEHGEGRYDDSRILPGIMVQIMAILVLTAVAVIYIRVTESKLRKEGEIMIVDIMSMVQIGDTIQMS